MPAFNIQDFYLEYTFGLEVNRSWEKKISESIADYALVIASVCQ